MEKDEVLASLGEVRQEAHDEHRKSKATLETLEAKVERTNGDLATLSAKVDKMVDLATLTHAIVEATALRVHRLDEEKELPIKKLGALSRDVAALQKAQAEARAKAEAESDRRRRAFGRDPEDTLNAIESLDGEGARAALKAHHDKSDQREFRDIVFAAARQNLSTGAEDRSWLTRNRHALRASIITAIVGGLISLGIWAAKYAVRGVDRERPAVVQPAPSSAR